MNHNEFSSDPLALHKDQSVLTLAVRDGVSAIAETGCAVAFGYGATARSRSSTGLAVAFGSEARAEANLAVGLDGWHTTVVGRELAVALGYHSVAEADAIAIAANILCRAHAGRIAIAVDKAGLADALIAIALGEEGLAVARAGGTIVIAFYDRHPGHWESPLGCDPCWVEGDTFLAGLKVSRVGNNGILPDRKYALDRSGEFRDMGPADKPNPFIRRDS